MKLFEDLPSTNRPITAENLNQIQDNLVVVSVTEPTGDNREKVWIQKGKNLFDKNSLFTGYRFGSDGLLFADSAYSSTDYISVKSNTIYTVNWQMETRECVCYYDETKTFISRNTATSPFTTPTNCKYIRASRISTGINTAQIEQGSTATEYEEYIEPKIYVKNDNDVYEEFINAKDIPSGVGQYDITLDCGLVLHFFKYGEVVNCIAEGTISSLNKDTDQACNIPKEFAPVYAFRHVVVMNETGILGYININTDGYFLVRAKTAISSNTYPRFSFSYIAGN